MRKTATSVASSVIEGEDAIWEDKCYDIIYSDKLPMRNELLSKYGNITNILKVFLKSQVLYESMIIKTEMEKLAVEKIDEYNDCVRQYNDIINKVRCDNGWQTIMPKRFRKFKEIKTDVV